MLAGGLPYHFIKPTFINLLKASIVDGREEEWASPREGWALGYPVKKNQKNNPCYICLSYQYKHNFKQSLFSQQKKVNKTSVLAETPAPDWKETVVERIFF